jgi:hypothetical protein
MAFDPVLNELSEGQGAEYYKPPKELKKNEKHS